MPPFEIVHHNRPYQSKGPTLATASEFATEPFFVLLLAAAAASAGQTAILAFLPALVDPARGALSSSAHDFHVASLTAVHPLAALLAAPLWGWIADRVDYRAMLRAALVILALVTAPIGLVGLPELYALRLVAGMASAAIIPLGLLCASFAANERADQARRFTWLTAFLFLGDLAGPLVAEVSAAILPRAPLMILAFGIGAVGAALCAVRLPRWCAPCIDGGDLPAPTLGATLILLFVTIVAGGGLAAMHVNLLVTRSVISLSREEIAWMLSLCGLGMLAAQIFHARLDWLVTMPRRLGADARPAGCGALPVPVAASMAELSGIIVAAGWSSATLRLVTSFWISGAAAPSGLKLGLQHSAASIGQALAPLAIAVVAPGAQHLVLWGIGGLSLALLVSLPLAWRPRAIVKSSA
jgi:MFS family permease